GERRADQRGDGEQREAQADGDAQDAQAAGAIAFGAIPRFRHEDVAAPADDLVSGEIDHRPRLAARADFDLRIGVDELPVGARRMRILLDFDFAQRRRVESQAGGDLALRETPCLVLGQAGAGSILGQLVLYLAQLAVALNRHLPLLGAIGHVDAGKARVAHRPHWRREPAADEPAVGLGAGLEAYRG